MSERVGAIREQMDNREFESACETIGQALDVDPGNRPPNPGGWGRGGGGRGRAFWVVGRVLEGVVGVSDRSPDGWGTWPPHGRKFATLLPRSSGPAVQVSSPRGSTLLPLYILAVYGRPHMEDVP